jgi:hypothetical protein
MKQISILKRIIAPVFALFSLIIFNTQTMGPGSIPGGAPLDPSQLNLSPSEMAEMDKFISNMVQELEKLPPEELAKLEKQGEEILRSQGIDPKTLQPLAPAPIAPTTGQQPSPDNDEQEQPLPPQPVEPLTPPVLSHATALTEKRVSTILKQALEFLIMLRTVANTQEHTALDSLAPQLLELEIDLHLINTPLHHKKLVSTKQTHIIESLEQFIKDVTPYTTTIHDLIEPSDSDTDDELNPYKILNVSMKATTAQIKQAYKKLENTMSPDSLKKTAAYKKLSAHEQKHALKQAKLNFATIQDAYKQLIEERAQVDRALISAESIDQLENILNIISKPLSTIFYQQQLLTLLTNYFKAYEPELLEQKKKNLAEAKKRFAEQNKAATVKGTTYTGPTDIAPTMGSNFMSDNSGNYGGYTPEYSSPEPYQPAPSSTNKPATKEEAKDHTPGEQPKMINEANEKEKKDKEEQDKKDKDAQEKKAAQKEELTKTLKNKKLSINELVSVVEDNALLYQEKNKEKMELEKQLPQETQKDKETKQESTEKITPIPPQEKTIAEQPDTLIQEELSKKRDALKQETIDIVDDGKQALKLIIKQITTRQPEEKRSSTQEQSPEEEAAQIQKLAEFLKQKEQEEFALQINAQQLFNIVYPPEKKEEQAKKQEEHKPDLPQKSKELTEKTT